ncbi:unnamed protein product [Phaedon cochleariae]|uniref:Uncharacterized protein n=1 Tax=Phaedon cochleariae TaxID=80249 RepID=A0A9P0DKM0_PHACE|nr:unnamed protein product [Phaedon cochleariae]
MGVEMTNCCGFSLKHGTIIIGVVQSIIAFMFLVLAAAYAENPHELIDMSDPSIVPDLSVLRGILIGVAVLNGLLCVFSILLIIGAETNRPALLRPWLVLNPVALILYIICNVVAIIHHNNMNNTPFIVGHFLLTIMATLVVCYKILCVWNFHKHLKSLNF